MLKPKTILALFEDGSDEAMKFALPYAADILRKIIKVREEEEETQYIKDEQEGKLMENSFPIKTEELCSNCLRRKECYFLRCEECKLAYCDDEDAYYCRCDSIFLGECCPFYISCEK